MTVELVFKVSDKEEAKRIIDRPPLRDLISKFEARHRIIVLDPNADLLNVRRSEFLRDKNLRARALVWWAKQMMLPREERSDSLDEIARNWMQHKSVEDVFATTVGLGRVMPDLLEAMTIVIERKHGKRMPHQTRAKLRRDKMISIVKENLKYY